MITQSRFSSAYDAKFVDATASSDRAFGAEGAGSSVVTVAVMPWGESPWTATFAAPAADRRALSALLGTPSPTGLCVVQRGTAFLGDVLHPDSFEVVPTAGPVVGAEELADEGVLLLITPWAISAIGASARLWTTGRIAIDGLRVDEASDGWVRGVADPDDDEPRDFAVNLETGDVIGGVGVA